MLERESLQNALKEVFDPELPVNIYDLGLIYDLQIEEHSKVVVTYTLTNPNCPVSEQLAGKIREAIARVNGVQAVETKLVWEPPWDKDKMTFEGKMQASLLGF